MKTKFNGCPGVVTMPAAKAKEIADHIVMRGWKVTEIGQPDNPPDEVPIQDRYSYMLSPYDHPMSGSQRLVLEKERNEMMEKARAMGAHLRNEFGHFTFEILSATPWSKP